MEIRSCSVHTRDMQGLSFRIFFSGFNRCNNLLNGGQVLLSYIGMTVQKSPRQKALLKEFFLNATLLALINELGRESARFDRKLQELGIESTEADSTDRTSQRFT